MNFRQLVIAVVIIIAAIVDFPLSAYAGDPQSDSIAQITALSERSMQVGQECKAFIDSLRAVTKDSERKEYYISRTSALAVLDRADGFPGTPVVTSQALELLLSMGNISEGKDAQQLRFAIASLSDCHVAEFYGFLTRLVHPATLRLLTSQERVRARNLVLAYIRRESDGDAKPAIQTVFITELLNQGVHNGLMAVSREGRAELGSLVFRVREFRKESVGGLAQWEGQESVISTLKSDEKSAANLVEGMSEQLQEVESLRYDLQDLIQSESDHGYLLPLPVFPAGHLALLK